MATINDPKQMDPNDVVTARTKDPVTDAAQHPESSGENHQVPVKFNMVSGAMELVRRISAIVQLTHHSGSDDMHGVLKDLLGKEESHKHCKEDSVTGTRRTGLNLIPIDNGCCALVGHVPDSYQGKRPQAGPCKRQGSKNVCN